jgi:hypothetical protein
VLPQIREEKMNTELDTELIKTIISTASGRDEGFKFTVVMTRDAAVNRKLVLLREVKPGIVKKMTDGRIGFNVGGKSYITTNKESGERFMQWLKNANTLAMKGAYYGQPESCYFSMAN